MRAKARLQGVVAKSIYDLQLQIYVDHAQRYGLSDEEVAIVAKRLEEASRTLSKEDMTFLKEGLQQPSRVGLKRFVKDILTAA
jgi:hypothetical protein